MKPEWPHNSLIAEYSVTFCDICGSSIKRRFGFLWKLGCIHPQCKDYYKINKCGKLIWDCCPLEGWRLTCSCGKSIMHKDFTLGNDFDKEVAKFREKHKKEN